MLLFFTNFLRNVFFLRDQTYFLVFFKFVISILKESSWIPFHYSHAVDHVKRLRTTWQTFRVSWFHARQQKSNYYGISFFLKNRKSSSDLRVGWGSGCVSSCFWWSQFFSEEVPVWDVDKEKSMQKVICVLWSFLRAIKNSFLTYLESESGNKLDFEDLLQNWQWRCKDDKVWRKVVSWEESGCLCINTCSCP